MIKVEVCTTVDTDLVDAFARLLPQLSSSSPPPTQDEIEAIVGSEACSLLVARDGDAVVGSLTLVVFPIPTGRRAWIEDVVVDEAAHGRGVGELLNRRALELAAEAGCRTVDLTSRPSREAANRLYHRLGFELRQSNLYRFELDRSEHDRR